MRYWLTRLYGQSLIVAGVTTMLMALILWPFTQRALRSWLVTPLAMTNIYQQQRQMAEFLATYFTNQPIAANDIGAIAYYSSVEIIDLVGLANLDVARAKLEGTYDHTVISRVTQAADVTIAIVYDKAYPVLPAHWVKVSEWTIPDNVIAYDDTVSFYATTPETVHQLAGKLMEFAHRLPAGVQQEWPCAAISDELSADCSSTYR